MEWASFTFRDWAFLLGVYVVWFAPAVLIWNFARIRSNRPLVRAAIFGALFAPGVIPIVREAYVVGPAILGLGYMTLEAAFEPTFIADFVSHVLLWNLAPIFALTLIYLTVAQRQRLLPPKG